MRRRSPQEHGEHSASKPQPLKVADDFLIHHSIGVPYPLGSVGKKRSRLCRLPLRKASGFPEAPFLNYSRLWVTTDLSHEMTLPCIFCKLKQMS